MAKIGFPLVTSAASDFSVATDFTAAFTSLADTSNTGLLGSKVSMSADKSTMIMHRLADSDVATSSGAIEIFKNNNDGTWSYVEKFVIPSQTPGANGGYNGSNFGDGVALSADGSKIAVSGSGHGVNGANQNCGGAIWVLERQGDGTYAEFDRIDRPYSSNPNLGRAIDISADGNYIAAAGSQSTHVSNIVYKLNSGTGEYEKMNTTTDGASNGVSVNWGSGSNLARGGHTDMVAAISDDGLYTVIGNQGSYEFGTGYGYAAVGFYDGSNWGVQQELRPANTSDPYGGKYGVSVDINEDGTVCVVGSTRHYNSGNSSRVGAFYVWRRTGTSWTEEQRVLGTSTNGFLGNNVRILPDGNTIFATATQENGASNKKILVYTYDSGSGSWSLAETIETNYTDTNFENEDQMDVSRDGSLAVVTAYGNTGNKALFFETTGGPYVGGGGGYSGGTFTDSNGRKWVWNFTASRWDVDSAVDDVAAPTESLTDISQLTDSGGLLDAAGRTPTVITGTVGLNSIATPEAGRLVYEDTADRMYVYNGTGWQILHDINNPQLQAFDLIATGTDGDSFPSSRFYTFNDDGTEVTGKGSMSYTLATYALDTPYDVFNVSSRNSLRFVNPIPDHSYAFVYGIAFNGDGTKIFITDAVAGETIGKEINTFTLSTAYDISTMSSSPTATDNIFTMTGGASGHVEGLHFNSDGTKMYTWSDNDRKMHQYNLSTAYTPSTASLVTTLTFSTVIGQSVGAWQGTFNADGTRLYVADWTSSGVFLLRLSTGFDISTATYTAGEFFDLSAYAEYPGGLTLNADETVLTVRAQGLSPATGNLYQFLVPST